MVIVGDATRIGPGTRNSVHVVPTEGGAYYLGLVGLDVSSPCFHMTVVPQTGVCALHVYLANVWELSIACITVVRTVADF